jgi:hypothetical protein
VISTHASRAEDIRDEKPPTSSRLTSLFGEPGQASILHSESPEPGGAYGPATIRSSKKWLLLAAGLIAVAGLAAGARFLSIGQSSEAVTLSVLEREGQLDIEWNRQAAQVAKALGGRLEIADGPQTRTIQLTPADLALGKVSYKRDTGDIQVRMIVDEPGGEKVQKASRFFGTPPPKANEDELKSLQKRKDELDAEVGRLKQSNNEQAQRIQQLERTLKILQTRQGN